MDCNDFMCFCDAEGRSYTSPRWQGAGYYRFLEPAGTMLPEKSPGYYHCGTRSVGWLNGTHQGLEQGDTLIIILARLSFKD